MLKIHLLIFFIVFLMILSSCNTEKISYLVELNDSTVNIIANYAKANNVDLKRKVISIRGESTGDRTNIYISNIDSKIYSESGFAPAYYSVVENEMVVLVYHGLETVISQDANSIVSEIEDVLAKHQINLKENSDSFYYAPTWLYSKCPSSSMLLKKMDPLEYYIIPCEYRLLQDTTKTDSLVLQRR